MIGPVYVIGPMYDLGYFGREASIVIAMFVGFLFGFFLERTGFGSAKMLSAVWYGRNFAVIRMMFSAVLVGMIGVFGFHYAGLLDLDLIYSNPTYVWPQLLGSFIFGIGFAVGGFCPGTCVVSSAIGRVDGIVFLLGFFFGVGTFTEAFPLLESFYKSGDLGRKLLSDVTPVPTGLWVLIITVFALIFFYVLRIIENRVNQDLKEDQNL